jgi:hypothetical protein
MPQVTSNSRFGKLVNTPATATLVFATGGRVAIVPMAGCSCMTMPIVAPERMRDGNPVDGLPFAGLVALRPCSPFPGNG